MGNNTIAISTAHRIRRANQTVRTPTTIHYLHFDCLIVRFQLRVCSNRNILTIGGCDGMAKPGLLILAAHNRLRAYR